MRSRIPETPPSFPFPVPGWDQLERANFFFRRAPYEEGLRALLDLGFETLSSKLGPRATLGDDELPRQDTFFIMAHPAGVLLTGDTYTGASPTINGSQGPFDPELRIFNQLHFYYQLDMGADPQAARLPYKSGSHGESRVLPDGRRLHLATGDVINGSESLAETLRLIQRAGRLRPFNEWMDQFIYLHQGHFSEIPPGASAADNNAIQERHGERLLEQFNAFTQGLGAPFDKLLSSACAQNLPEREPPRGSSSHAILNAQRERGSIERSCAAGWGEYAARCLNARGERWASAPEAESLTLWGAAVSSGEGAARLARSRPFEISPGGATMLQALMLGAQASESLLPQCLEFIAQTPQVKLASLANHLDARGVSAPMLCFEMQRDFMGSSEPAARIFQALHERLGAEMTLSSPRASALGLFFSDAHAPSHGTPNWSHAQRLLIYCQERGLPWAENARSPHAGRLPESADEGFGDGSCRGAPIEGLKALMEHIQTSPQLRDCPLGPLLEAKLLELSLPERAPALKSVMPRAL